MTILVVTSDRRNIIWLNSAMVNLAALCIKYCKQEIDLPASACSLGRCARTSAD
jgi:hypothetical protein